MKHAEVLPNQIILQIVESVINNVPTVHAQTYQLCLLGQARPTQHCFSNWKLAIFHAKLACGFHHWLGKISGLNVL